jgi:2-polyprenyl-6-methoxyphenol hydroxylase-like FAD-dependent oxidoreductase
MSEGHETILVAGAGIAGLGAALALGDGTREVTILDRDPPPPELSPDEAFYRWERKGATQLRHSHAFLGRLTALIRDRHPKLMEELLAEGTRLFGFRDGLPPPLSGKYRAAQGDDDLMLLFSRRTTLELVMRRYASRLPGVRFVTGAGVRGLIARRENGTILVEGLKVERDGTLAEMRADLIIDATGRNTAFPDWLRAEGPVIEEEESPCGILYFTRHYRLREGQDEPPWDGTPGGGDLGYIKYGVFIADNRHFSVTLATPEIETELRLAVVKPAVFDAACMAPARRGALDESLARRAGQPGFRHGQSAKRLAAFYEGWAAASARLLRAGRCGHPHESALRPRLRLRRGGSASAARSAGCDARSF